jgi:IPT/TIG domain/Glycosyl hydrolases family 16
VQLPATLGVYHTYRIVWGATQIDFYVDDVLATSITATLNNPMPAWISSGAAGHQLAVDWARVLQYPVTSGTFTSDVLDAGASTTWQALTWTGALPTGTTLTPQTRSSADATTWSAYQPLGAGGAIASPAGRFLQYQLAFAGGATASPSVNTVTVTFGSGGTGAVAQISQSPRLASPTKLAHPPTITRVSPVSGSVAGGSTVTITGTGFAAGARVVFDETQATNVTVVSATEITATAPTHAKSGSVDVTVFVGTQGAALLHGYAYGGAAPAPTAPPPSPVPASIPPSRIPPSRSSPPATTSTGTTGTPTTRPLPPSRP